MRIQRLTSATAAILLLFIVTTGNTWADQAAQPAPKLVVEETAFSFEPVVDGAIVNHDFMVRNTGDEVLKINKVKTG